MISLAEYAEMDDFLNMWLRKVKKISADLTPDEQAKITKAGADVYMQKLRDVTTAKHKSHHQDKVFGHAADHITNQATNVDGRKTGVSSVGWDNHYHAMNMMRVNNGTRFMKGDHFITNLQQSDETKEAVLKAESEAYQKLINDAGGDD